jgi:hypothetical protein
MRARWAAAKSLKKIVYLGEEAFAEDDGLAA